MKNWFAIPYIKGINVTTAVETEEIMLAYLLYGY